MLINTYVYHEGVTITRNITQLDCCRNDDCPDDIMVYLLKNNNKPECCWVRCSDVQNKQLLGSLLNEPYQDFGIHLGDSIRFGIMKQEEKYICVAQL